MSREFSDQPQAAGRSVEVSVGRFAPYEGAERGTSPANDGRVNLGRAAELTGSFPQASISADGRTLYFGMQTNGTRQFDGTEPGRGRYQISDARERGTRIDVEGYGPEPGDRRQRGRERQRDASHGDPRGPGEKVPVRQLYDYFIENGFTKAQAAGILGNMQTESDFRTNAYNPHEKAIGLCQWENSRRTDLEKFAARQGKPVTDWHVQVDFIMHEFSTTEKRAFAALKAAQTPEQAAKAFQSKYERSAALTNRATNARAIYDRL